MVSQQHAEIVERDGAMWLRDLGSTNGTFVNGQRLSGEDHTVSDGDILHFADLEYRLVRNATAEAQWMSLSQTMSLLQGLPGVAHYRELREILQTRAVRALYQPLVSLSGGAPLGYEALGRGTLADAPESPGELFAAAEAIGLAAELSETFRAQGLLEAADLPLPTRVFVNTHPVELVNPQALLASLEPIRLRPPAFDVVLEIHESAVTDVASLRSLRDRLEELGVGVAFDDFGVGQARLLELAEAAPNYLKVDAKLIRDLHLETKRKHREMLRTLVGLVLDMEIVAIAEGVETRAEADVCRDLGFEYAQGYLFGRPAPATALADESCETEVP
jgi:EAL domain-containing protein (putative c-di-GMP-specific phosphodiesterase class I)